MKSHCSALDVEEAFDTGVHPSGTGIVKGMNDGKENGLVDNDEKRSADFDHPDGNAEFDTRDRRSAFALIHRLFSFDHAVLPVPWQLIVAPCLVVVMTVLVMIHLHASNAMIVMLAVIVGGTIGIWLFVFLRSPFGIAARDIDETVDSVTHRSHGHRMDARECVLEAIRHVESETMEMIGGRMDSTEIDVTDGDAVSENNRHEEDTSVTADRLGRFPDTTELSELLATEVRLVTQAIQDMEREKTEICRSLDALKDAARTTNLLATKAAIEAPHNGKSDCAISATSDRVRHLASLSQDVTEKMQGLVGRLQETLVLVERVTTNDLSSVPGGVPLALRAIDALRSIHKSVTSFRSMCERIAVAIEQQRVIANGISRRMVALQERQRAEDQPRKLH